MPSLSTAQLRRADAVLEAVLDLEPEARADALNAACADEPEVRAEVEALLRAFDRTGTALDRTLPFHARDFIDALDDEPFEGTVDELAEPLQPGQTLGSYRVVKRVGTGGMSVVYLAERTDGPFRMRVAVKVTRRGMNTTDGIRRFRRERAVLARLQHPYIGRIFPDGGVTNSGLPYFVMEFIEGEPITAYCDRKQLPIAQRLALFRDVCEAVAYAHRQLVVHRDIKPGNVFVCEEGGAPIVKLLDFGIAKLLEEVTGDHAAEGPAGEGEAPLTREGARLLTPEYAAPEQVRGEPVTTATDVYALGVVLYELLCGARPYRIESRSFAHIEQVVGEHVPPNPSAIAVHTPPTASTAPEERARQRRLAHPARLRRALAGDLDAICLKALKKEPDLRYASAAELGADVDRFLTGQPVRAQRDSRRYRAAKFIGRHRASVALTALAALLLVGGIVTTSWQARVAAAERNQKRVEAARATAAFDFVVGMLATTDPAEAQGRTFTARDLLHNGLGLLDGLEGQPTAQASMMDAMGRVSLSLGLWPSADSLHRAALARYQAMGEGQTLAAAASREGLADVLMNQRAFAEAEALYREALAVRRRHLARADPAVLRALNGLAQALVAQAEPDQMAEAEALYREALALGPRGATGDPDGAVERSESLSGLANLLKHLGRPDEADAPLREALDLRHATLGSAHPQTADALYDLALLRQEQGAFREANRLHREAIAIYERAYGPDHPNVVSGLYSLGVNAQAAGDYREAIDLYREALARYATVLPEGHLWNAYALAGLGASLLAEDRPDEALPELERAADLYARTLEPDDDRLHQTRLRLASALLQLGRPDEAEPILRGILAHDPAEPLRERVQALLAEG